MVFEYLFSCFSFFLLRESRRIPQGVVRDMDSGQIPTGADEFPFTDSIPSVDKLHDGSITQAVQSKLMSLAAAVSAGDKDDAKKCIADIIIIMQIIDTNIAIERFNNMTPLYCVVLLL